MNCHAPPPAAGTALLQCFDASGNSEAEVTTVAGVADEANPVNGDGASATCT